MKELNFFPVLFPVACEEEEFSPPNEETAATEKFLMSIIRGTYPDTAKGTVNDAGFKEKLINKTKN